MSTIITDNPYTFTVADNMSVKAVFSPGTNNYLVAVNGPTTLYYGRTLSSQTTSWTISTTSERTSNSGDDLYFNFKTGGSDDGVENTTIETLDFSSLQKSNSYCIKINKNWSFSRCTSLKNIYFPNNISTPGSTLTQIWANAFRYCTGLKELDIISVSTGNLTFANCSNLKYISLSEKCSLADGTFSYSPVETIRVYDNFNTDSLGLSTSLWFYDNNAVENDAFQLKEIICDENSSNYSVENGILIRKSDMQALISIRQDDIIFPEGVLKINKACNRFKWANYIKVPSTCNNITSPGFSGCSGLTRIDILATTPPTLSSEVAFSFTNDCPIYVPAASVNAYKAASKWSSLASRIQALP